MATPQERFAQALNILKALQEKGIVGIFTDDIPTARYRQLLIKNGFIREVTKGWYIAMDPAEKEGETTSWYTSYWDFIAQYLNHKYGENWCLSAEQSLLLQAGNWSVPRQLLVRSPEGNNRPTPLPHNTSLFNLRTDIPSAGQTVISMGIRMYDMQSALIYSAATVYKSNAIDARTALSMIRDASELLPIMLDNGHTVLAGRLAGAFRNIQRERIADQIIETFRQAGYDIRETDPFDHRLDINLSPKERSPYANRIRLMWMHMRPVVIANLPQEPGLPENIGSFLKDIDDIYVTDAYNSLSIERYRVTPELIEKVSSGKWNVLENEEDQRQRDAMAARGYYQAFQAVKQTIEQILAGGNAGDLVDIAHAKWYRELFDPSVVAGLLKASDLAGYRNHQVYIGSSKHVPLSVDAMRDAMPVLFELLQEETHASVRAVLGHFIFVFIHPYMDGNGRMGRFLMNAMLASGGYPWTVIPFEKREEYMAALESASVQQDIEPFAQFIGYLLTERLAGKMVARLPAEKGEPGP
nr:Fic family protein [uncultured Dyadobacter sp.]